MELGFTAEQTILRESAREFLEQECPMDQVRKTLEADSRFPESLWSQLAELGWFGLQIPEEWGGSGLGALDLALLQEELGDSVEVRATSVIYLLGGWLDEIIAGQSRGLGVIFLIIACMMAIGLRSIRIGLLSMIPNALPLLVLGGVLGLSYDEVDSDSLFLAMLAIGVGVDDTIHFLMRYRIESERSTDQRLALERTFEFAGRAIVMTTITLALGFALAVEMPNISRWLEMSL
mgnify:CR=1 FL=1